MNLLRRQADVKTFQFNEPSSGLKYSEAIVDGTTMDV